MHEVTNQGFDRDQLSPMAIATKDALHRGDLHAIADKGYLHLLQLWRLTRGRGRALPSRCEGVAGVIREMIAPRDMEAAE